MTEMDFRKNYRMKTREEGLAFRLQRPAPDPMRPTDEDYSITTSEEVTEVVTPGEAAPIDEGGFIAAAPQLEVLAPSSVTGSIAASLPIEPSSIAHDTQAQSPRSSRAQTRNNTLLMVIFAAVIAVLDAALVLPGAYDNDIWFILATGEEIVDHGIPYINPFSIHENMGIVVQQWLLCVLSYELHSIGGFVLLGLWVSILFALMVLSLYKVGRIIRGDRFGGEWILLLIIPTLLPILAYSSVRPHLYTMIAFAWVVGFCELYRRNSDWRFLIPLPFIVVAHVNFHAAMAPFDLVIIACYAIPNFLALFHKRGRFENARLARGGYKRIPLLIALVVSAAALLVNPYFIDGALYLVISYGSAAYRNYISEMGALTPANHYMFAMVVVMLTIAAICVGRKGFKNINLPFYLLVLGTSFLSFTQVRNLWLCPLFCYMILVWTSAGYSIPLFIKRKWNHIVSAIMAVAGVVVVGVLGLNDYHELEDIPENNAMTPVAAMDYLEEAGVDRQTARVYTLFNAGGYIEYRGYKVNIDPRPELWAPGITGLDFDYYTEYVDMMSGDMYVSSYLEQYDFNVFIVPKYEDYSDTLKESDEYFEISGGEDYRAFILRSAYESLTGHSIDDAPRPQINNVEKS